MLIPASFAKTDVRGVSISHPFAHHELECNKNVRTFGNAFGFYFPHNTDMANRRGIPKQGANWFIREWMDYYGVKQSKMTEIAGWSKASASQIYNGVQDYNPKLVKEAAAALNLQDYELLMPPERAMALRRLQASAEQIVQIAHDADQRDGTNG